MGCLGGLAVVALLLYRNLRPLEDQIEVAKRAPQLGDHGVGEGMPIKKTFFQSKKLFPIKKAFLQSKKNFPFQIGGQEGREEEGRDGRQEGRKEGRKEGGRARRKEGRKEGGRARRKEGRKEAI